VQYRRIAAEKDASMMNGLILNLCDFYVATWSTLKNQKAAEHFWKAHHKNIKQTMCEALPKVFYNLT